MKNIFLVYKTDVWHSYNSRVIIGVCTTLENVFKVIKQQAKKEGFKITKENLEDLNHMEQTQSYKGEGEFVFEEMEINTLL